MKNRNRNGGTALALAAALMMALPVLATPVTMDADSEGAGAAPAERRAGDAATMDAPAGLSRSADLGISTALPLGRRDDVLWSGGYAEADVRQQYVVEPGTLALVGLGLVAFGLSRQLKRRRKDR